jgi:hypothetical protein
MNVELPGTGPMLLHILVPEVRRRPQPTRLPDNRGTCSWLGDATSPVVLRYRVLGVTMSQTVTVATPILVILPYPSCM